jgi:hypothetical protein
VTVNLKETLFDCLPAGRYALAGMLRLLEVVETDAVPSAAVECTAQPRLLINPAFVAEHASTPEKLMMLVLHEVHHVLLGHTRRLPRESEADNFVFDCVINALLCRMFPKPEYTALFRDFYPDDHFPACLLRPADGWSHIDSPVPKALRRRRLDMAAARSVYRCLYSAEGASYDEIRSILPALVAVDLSGIRLLGDHDRSTRGLSGDDATAFAQAVADLVRHWPTPPQPLRGQSLDGMLRTRLTGIRCEPDNRARLRSLILKLADLRVQGRGPMREQLSPQNMESPVPTLERRAIVRRSLGMTPLLFRSEVAVQRRRRSGARVHLYLDVSGSMDAVMQAVYGAVLDCQAWVAPQVHLFSTEVVDVGLAQLRRGLCSSTSGTDIDCVVDHMRRNRVRRAVILTDGWVGKPSANSCAALGRVNLGIAYTQSHSTTDLAPFCRHAVALHTPT